MMRPLAILAVSLLLQACPDTEPAPSDVITDIAQETDGDLDGDAIPTCCPIAQAPSCDCAPTGGSPDQPGGCQSVCDAAPPAWSMGVDENGCPVWNVGSQSCFVADAGATGD